MNTLSVERITPEDYPSEFPGFQLLVDGQSIGNVPGCVEDVISYWEFENELAPFTKTDNPNDCDRIVGVCSCGHAGCGSTLVRVTKSNGVVRFHEFSGLQPGETPKELTFTEANYNAVMAQMRQWAAEFAADDEKFNEQQN